MIKKVKLIVVAIITTLFISCDFSQLLMFEEEIFTGFISGSVRDNWDNPMSGVQVNVSGNYDYSTYTDSMGGYYLEAPEGYQRIEFYKDGYSFDGLNVNVSQGFTEYVDVVIPWGEPENTGKLTGTIIDVTNGSGIDGVYVQVSGDSYYSTSTDGAGYFEILVPEGFITLDFERYGFHFPSVDVNVTAWEVAALRRNVTLGSPTLGYGEYRFVVVWNDLTPDLDVNMITPSGNTVDRFNTYHDGAEFHYDVNNGYGPESITITSQLAGDYRFYIYNYSNSEYYDRLEARVLFFNSSGLERIIDPPGFTFGRYWDVATLNGDFLSETNQITSTEPVFVP